jgi:hypothetical protein
MKFSVQKLILWTSIMYLWLSKNNISIQLKLVEINSIIIDGFLWMLSSIFQLVKYIMNLSFRTRLEIISVRVSERHVAEKFRYHIGFFRYHIGNTDTTSEIPIPHRKYRYHMVSEKTEVVSVFPMWYRNFSATCLSDTRTEIISNRVILFRDLVAPHPSKSIFD